MKDGEVTFLVSPSSKVNREEEGEKDFELFFFFFFQGHVQTSSYQLKVSICKPMARNLHRTSTGIIYEKSLEIH